MCLYCRPVFFAVADLTYHQMLIYESYNVQALPLYQPGHCTGFNRRDLPPSLEY